VAFWVVAPNFSEVQLASIFRGEVRKVLKLRVYTGL
jgi:hypothetical protein